MKIDLEGERDELAKLRNTHEIAKNQLREKTEESRFFLQKLGEYEQQISELEATNKINSEKLSNQREQASENLEEASNIRKQIEERVAELEQENSELHSYSMEK